jgi:hypothetical protein
MNFAPHTIAERGRKIYERVRHRMEAEQRGKFVVIDLNTERNFVADSPEDAYRAARRASMTGPFHIVRVGHKEVYRTTRSVWPRRAAG